MISIGQMAKYCQTSIQTLRLYDQKGLLTPALVDPQTHYRYYQPEQIFQFNLIKYLQSTSSSLQEIATVMNDNSINLSDFWQEQEQKIQHQIEEQQRKLVIAKFQQQQLNNLASMQAHLGKQPYVKNFTR
ncbi:MerR family transcriptional regulator [Limosilactobacillus difficilis]|uniref:MerR family transcriptional regulator n=1 Tax=Limosilactobacillus difficilis TaxID=2991838 RepID=UPI0024BBA161|nr:MerR family transcriptional regulator [Limosilactobacillus difficilis]